MQRIDATLRAAVLNGEIQVELVEIDDTKTVMTNGVLNRPDGRVFNNENWSESQETLT